VVVVGLTVTELAAGGVAPLLAVHTKGPVPEEFNVTVCPAQIEVTEGVIAIGATGAIDTPATAVAVQAPVPDKTVYVVLTVGDTVTVPTAAGLAPELAVQLKGPAPDEVRTTLCPEQIVDKEGVIAMDGTVEIETVATAVAVQVPVPDKTV